MPQEIQVFAVGAVASFSANFGLVAKVSMEDGLEL